MLVHLSVHNYAIVEHLDLELDRGMSVITGETGAGKSIMLDALGLTLGEYLVRRCRGSDKYDAWSFDGSIFPSDQDFFWTDLFDASQSTQLEQTTYGVSKTASSLTLGARSPVLERLWRNASAEWL